MKEFAKVRADIAEWLGKERFRVDLHEAPRVQLEKFLAGRYEHIAEIDIALSAEHVWLTHAGALKAFERAEDAAAVFHDGLLCNLLAHRIEARLHQESKFGRPQILLTKISILLLTLLATRSFEHARTVFELIDRGLQGRLLSKPVSASKIAPIAVALGREFFREDPPVVADVRHPPFRELAEHWRSPDEATVRRVMTNALDHHAKLTGGDAEFNSPVFWIYPVEVIAALRMREESKLPTPEIDHVLWRSPLNQMVVGSTSFHDPFLQQVCGRLESLLASDRASIATP